MKIPKTDYVRSPALLRACRQIPCQHCGRDDGTVAAAHANWSEFGKARGLKASDQYVASLCERCHYELDQGRLWDREKRKEVWLAAHRKTVAALQWYGLWPPEVPLP